MSFEDFVKSGSVGVDLNIAIGQIQGTLPGATVHWIDAAEKSYGVFFQGIEILFWGGVLYSVQFEIANMEKLQIGNIPSMQQPPAVRLSKCLMKWACFSVKVNTTGRKYWRCKVV